MIKKLRDFSYKERIKERGLRTLETRRLRGDRIEVLRHLMDIWILIEISGHDVALVKDKCVLDIRK